MLARIIVVDMIAGAVFLAAWYCLFSIYNRGKSRKVLGWIELAFRGHGQVADAHWEAGSRFRVQMTLTPAVFRHPALSVQLHPREVAPLWLVSRLRGQQESLTFEADLDCAPCFNLEVHNHRWFGRTRRRLPANCHRWEMEHAGPFVLTTRKEWQREITNMMGALVASRRCDCLTVSIRRGSPHFSVTVPLTTIEPASDAKFDIFDVLRELAAGVTSARF